MIRTPELKKQASLLMQEIQAELSVHLSRAKALEIVAKLNGLKNWRHAVSVDSASVDEPGHPELGSALPVDPVGVVTSEDAFFTTFAAGEDIAALKVELIKKGFSRVPGIAEEFNRALSSSADGGLAYQFIIFQSDESTGKRFVNMDCALSNGDYLTETPLFTGETVLETLRCALKVADEQCETALKEIASLKSEIE